MFCLRLCNLTIQYREFNWVSTRCKTKKVTYMVQYLIKPHNIGLQFDHDPMTHTSKRILKKNASLYFINVSLFILFTWKFSLHQHIFTLWRHIFALCWGVSLHLTDIFSLEKVIHYLCKVIVIYLALVQYFQSKLMAKYMPTMTIHIQSYYISSTILANVYDLKDNRA